MTPTITAFEPRPTRGRASPATCACAGRSRRWAQPYDGPPRLLRRAEGAGAPRRASPSARSRPTRTAASSSSNPAPSCSTSPSATPGLLPGRPGRPRPRHRLDVRRARTVEPPILDLQTARLARGRQAAGPGSACPWSTTASAPACASSPARLGEADWLDGAFSAGDLMMVHALRRLGPSGLLDGASDARRLRRPRRGHRTSPAVPARLRGPASASSTAAPTAVQRWATRASWRTPSTVAFAAVRPPAFTPSRGKVPPT